MLGSFFDVLFCDCHVSLCARLGALMEDGRNNHCRWRMAWRAEKCSLCCSARGSFSRLLLRFLSSAVLLFCACSVGVSFVEGGTGVREERRCVDLSVASFECRCWVRVSASGLLRAFSFLFFPCVIASRDALWKSDARGVLCPGSSGVGFSGCRGGSSPPCFFRGVACCRPRAASFGCQCLG